MVYAHVAFVCGGVVCVCVGGGVVCVCVCVCVRPLYIWKDTESWCCTVLVQIPLCACQNLTVWSYPAVARITGSLPTVPWFTFMVNSVVLTHGRSTAENINMYKQRDSV